MPDKVRLGPLRDLWKVVADWVTGASTAKPVVEADLSDKPGRELGKVTVPGVATQTTLAQVLQALQGALEVEGEVNISDKPGRKLGEVTIAGSDLATEATLAQSVSQLNQILARLEGKLDAAILDSFGNPITTSNRLPVDVGGQIQADVDLGDVTVDLGELQQGKRGPNAEPWEVTLSGQTVPPGESPNRVLAEGRIEFGFAGEGAMDVPVSQSRGVMLSIQSDDEFGECKLSFLHELDGGVTVPWFDGDGNDVTVSLPANKAVIGPFQGWPRFEGGRLQARLTSFDPLEWSNIDEADHTAYGIAVDHEGYVYTSTYKGNIRKIGPDGATLWVASVTTSRVFDVAVDVSGNVYTIGDEGIIFALDSSGDSLWTHSVGARSQSISVEGNYVYVAPRNPNLLIQLDISGADAVTPPVETWTYSLSGSPYGNIIVDGNHLFACGSARIYAFDKATSPPQEIWTESFSGLQALGFDANRDVLYASGTSGILTAFNAQTGAPIWSTDVDQNVIGLAVDDNGYIYTSGLNSVQMVSPDGKIIDNYINGSRSNRIVTFDGAVYTGYSNNASQVIKLRPPKTSLDVSVREVV